VAAIPASILAGDDWPASALPEAEPAVPEPVAANGRAATLEPPERESLVAGVELGFEGSGERIGVRPGSSTEEGYGALAEQLLGDLRRTDEASEGS
jgi:hypothetical protein